MTTHLAETAGHSHPGRLAINIAATAAALGAVVAWPLAVLDPPQSGPWCRLPRCLTYPYTDAAYAGIDYWWMYPVLLAVVAFATLLNLIEPLVDTTRTTAARMARLAANSGATVLVVAYALQLMVIQPSIIKGEQDGLTFWTQFNPHGGFIALESVGYLLLSISLLAAARLTPGPGAAQRVVRYGGGGLGAVGVLALPIEAALLGSDLEYFYELTSLSMVWTAIAVTSFALAAAHPHQPSIGGLSGH